MFKSAQKNSFCNRSCNIPASLDSFSSQHTDANVANLFSHSLKQKSFHNTSLIRHNRPKGLPSSKTISDFAFDPYAGFMSKKEREWLIKIHLIQCVGTGNPVDDDFYYTVNIKALCFVLFCIIKCLFLKLMKFYI